MDPEDFDEGDSDSEYTDVSVSEINEIRDQILATRLVVTRQFLDLTWQFVRENLLPKTYPVWERFVFKVSVGALAVLVRDRIDALDNREHLCLAIVRSIMGSKSMLN